MDAGDPRSEKPRRYCRVTGLASDAGKSMNGSAAIVQTGQAHGDPEKRLTIGAVDGRPGGPAKVKRKNITIFPEGYEVIGTGVGRGTLREKTFNAVISGHRHSTILSEVPVTGGCARSRGILKAFEKFLQSVPPHLSIRNNPNLNWLVLSTDLNVARALNKLVLNEPAELAPELDGTLQSIRKLLKQKNMVDAESSSKDALSRRILVKFEPHRCLPKIFDQPIEAKTRVAAVSSGTYHIYPCSYEKYMDALEVRYVDSSASTPTIYQDIYIDYGTEEALTYPRNVSALNELDRLAPNTLAEVDPQMFWALVLRIDQFLPILQELDRADLVEQWAALAKGVERQKTRVTNFLQEHRGFGNLKFVNDQHIFSISDAKHHADLALDHAVLALTMLEDVVSQGQSKPLPVVVYKDLYKTTPIGRIILPFVMAGKIEQRVSQSPADRKAALYNAFKSQRFPEISGSDPAEACENCGATDSSQLKDCGGCGGVAYCSRECQKSSWRKHKPNCSRLDSHAAKIMRRLKQDGALPRCNLYTDINCG
jgi:hypothetical protein